jgi:hypothetical protein
MSDYPFHFDAKVQLFAFEKFSMSGVYLPKKLEPKLPLKATPRLRISGEINGIRFEGALQPTKRGWYLMVSRRLLKICESGVGEKVRVEFDIADQNAVEVPDDLRMALDADDEMAAKWNALTPGKRRSRAYLISTAKRPETREQRIEQLFDFLRNCP